MPDIKNFDKNEADIDLKRADAEKSSGAMNQFVGINLHRAKKSDDNVFQTKQVARKRLPVVVDVIIAILFVAIFLGVITGAYFAFRAFAVDYENVKVEYVLLVTYNDGVNYLDLDYKSVYYEDVNGIEHFGKIQSASVSEKNRVVLITVAATARFKEGSGYSFGDIKLAVGQSYELRAENGSMITGTVVELFDNTHPKASEVQLPVNTTVLDAEGGR